MGVRVSGGTIVISIGDMEFPDEDSEAAVEAALTQAAEGAIEGACDTYRNGLSVESVNLEHVEAMAKWAEVRLTASVTVAVRYDPEDGVQPSDWADDHGWNYLAFKSQDVDFDYDVRDDDAGEPGSSEAEWDSEDAVEDPREAHRLHNRMMADRAARQNDAYRRLKDVVDRVVVHGDTFMDGYLDTDLAHDRANVINDVANMGQTDQDDTP